MTQSVGAIPAVYRALTPYLIVGDGKRAIEFYQQAFAAVVRMTMPKPDGRIGHAELEIADSLFMLADEYPEMGALSPQSVGGTPVLLHLYVKDVDAVVKQAVAAGAKLLREVQNQFYGDRSGSIADPFGHVWVISTHVEDVNMEEMKQRAASTGCHH